MCSDFVTEINSFVCACMDRNMCIPDNMATGNNFQIVLCCFCHHGSKILPHLELANVDF